MYMVLVYNLFFLHYRCYKYFSIGSYYSPHLNLHLKQQLRLFLAGAKTLEEFAADPANEHVVSGAWLLGLSANLVKQPRGGVYECRVSGFRLKEAHLMAFMCVKLERLEQQVVKQ